jgi:hypothetical protein
VIDEHIAAFAALVDAVPNVTVYADEAVPNNPSYPYVVLYGNQGLPSRTSMDPVSDQRETTVQSTVVAVTQGQARALADRVEAAVLDVRPTVAGRISAPVEKRSSQPVRLDHDIKPPVFYAVDVWAFTTIPG